MADQPNIILINCDDLGYGDLGCYGSRFNNTPALDRMALEGVRFTDFYMASPVCSPSRGGMMTGCYPPRIGFGDFELPSDMGGDGVKRGCVLFPGGSEGLNPDEVSMASVLKGAGYATCHIGKWHCGDQAEFMPTRHGFDEYFGLPYSNDMGISATRPDSAPLPLMDGEEVLELQPDQRSLTVRYVEHSVKFMRENKGRPFFLYLAHMHVHLPHYPPEIFMKRSVNGPYGAAVECIDWSVSVIMHELKRLGLDENTLVVFTSDNGGRGDQGGSNGQLRGRKGETWEGGMRVPCIMRWPGRIKAGQECGAVATSMDFYPTFAGLAGGEVPGDRIIDGKDIGGLMFAGEGAGEGPHEAFFYYLANQLEAVRSGDWKLHVARGGEVVCELYDLKSDVGESRDLSGERPEVVERLQGLVAGCRADIGDEVLGVVGKNCRPIGRVEGAKVIAEYDEDHPYIISMYDIPDCG